ncbi:hypothetical protein OZX74_00885 [Bifidobacterium sp. ESL0798]|uniref:hypothetical protein n=1 Tax=Bifidobacterium sp. ESL0798 TaxID=2983235 RepID=UPI0023F7EC1A|nr:hypothetical protein [Bifidobacterium sp. ESL0798]WEV74154.1 hypothetical protein OZX74_00885 [Bifidobacterium sp. ESL0798]
MAEDANLVVVDDYLTNVGNTCTTYSVQLNDLLNKYLKELDNIANDALPSGKLHDAIVAFRDAVSSLYGGKGTGKLTEMGKSLDHSCRDFIGTVDNDDKFIY